MPQISPETVWSMSEEKLSAFLDSGFLLSKNKRVHFYAPSFMYYKTCHYCSSPTDFPTISVTGTGCSLKCKHCSGIVLDTMYPAATPEELVRLCRELKAKGARGCLISGGCLPDGSIPLDRFADAIAEVKRDLDLTVFVHTGVVRRETAGKLADAGVDAALLDIIGSDETVAEIYNLNVTVKDYEYSLAALKASGLVFVPHVIAGLHYGKLKGEMEALKMIARHSPSALVVIAFMPIHGTPMEEIEPPAPIDVARVLATARVMFPRTPLVLGCMRPKSKHRTKTDMLAMKSGVDAIAFPTQEAVEFAKQEGFETSFSSMCCAQVYMDLKGLLERTV